MIVYDENKEKILNDYDLDNGYLIPSTIVKTIPAIEEVKEQGYYKTIKEYENGGKDVEWVVDVKGVEAQPEKTITENILIYKPFTDKDYYLQEYNNLVDWYNTEYTKLEQKYRRLNTLKILTDSGLDPLGCLIELYQEAERKRKRIQELEALLVK